MRSAVLVEPGRVELRDVPVPTPGPGEVVLRIETALTCGTDIKTFRRGHPKIPLPAPLGHEFAGTVAAAGPGAAFREGDRVAAVPTAPCGECRLCERGRDNLCPAATGAIALGAFADYLRLPAHIVAANVFHRAERVPAETCAALEPLACVVHGAARLDFAGDPTVLVLGDGAIALLFIQVARLAGAGRIGVMGRHASRLEIARALGADQTFCRESEAAARDWTAGVGADIVIECTGSIDAWQMAPSLASRAGRVLLFGGCAAGTRASFDTYRLHYDEVDLMGAFHYGRADVRAAWRLITERSVRIAPLITHHRPLERLDEALELALSRTAIKVAVRP